MWFILNPPGTATVEVLSLESFLWLRESSIPALRQLSDPNLKQFYHSISEHVGHFCLKKTWNFFQFVLFLKLSGA